MIENLLIAVTPPRTGTSWLHRRLREHSRIRIAAGRVKEVHYFDRAHPAVARLIQLRNARLAARADMDGRLQEFLTGPFDDAWYERIFRAKPGDWCLDMSPGYHMLTIDGFRHVKQIAQRVEVVVVRRDPIDAL